MKRGGEIKRRAHRSPVRRTGPSPETVQRVWARDGGRCAACAGLCTGERGRDWSVHHRLARKRGGTTREFVNLPGNLVLLHGHGTALCHGDIERDRARATTAGLLVREGVLLPVEIAVMHAVHGGWTMLADDGTFEVQPTCVACVCDPLLCGSDDTGQHCADRSCGSCLHGCPIECEVCAPPRGPS